MSKVFGRWDRSKIGIVVGLSAEAKLLRHTGFSVEIGGGDAPGAALAANRLIGKNVGALISFGLAGGLRPGLRPGTLLIPRAVIDGQDEFICSNELIEFLGGANSNTVSSSQRIVESPEAKSALYQQTKADAVDLESGALARAAAKAQLPFAVLRAVADPAENGLPPAAKIALNRAGNIKLSSVLASVFRQPGQIPGLLALARDSFKARAALLKALRRID